MKEISLMMNFLESTNIRCDSLKLDCMYLQTFNQIFLRLDIIRIQYFSDVRKVVRYMIGSQQLNTLPLPSKICVHTP